MELLEKRLREANRWIAENKEKTAGMKWRQGYHFMAPVGWMNDPNGLIEWRGEYHLFYQFYPYSSKWGMMHWGHAVSKDLCHWEHLPVALAPSEEYDDWDCGGCFSGSAVDHEGRLAVIYTGTSKTSDEVRQVQCLAESSDGLHFSKYEGNPVIPSYPDCAGGDFRDPKVWRHGDRWYLVCGSGKNGKGMALLYRSEDLIQWEFVNVLAESDGTLGYMWECPDFFEVGGKAVLTFSPMGAGEHQCVYLAGTMDYETGRFSEEFRGDVDCGMDYYASQSFLDHKGRRILIGWANGWEWMPWFTDFGAAQEEGWCGHLAIPREIKMGENGKPRFLPIEELESLRQKNWHLDRFSLAEEDGRKEIAAGDGVHCEIRLSVDRKRTTAKKLMIELRKMPDSEIPSAPEEDGKRRVTILAVDLEKGLMSLDRSRTDGKRKGVCSGQFQTERDHLDIRIFMDSCSVEVFADDYHVAMSANIYPEEGDTGAALYVVGGTASVESFDTWQLEL